MIVLRSGGRKFYTAADRHSLGRLVERHGSDVQLLDLVNRADGQSAVIGQSQTVTEGRENQRCDLYDTQLRQNLCAAVPVRVALGVERAHVVHLLEVDVREDQFVVAGVDDGRSVRAGEHIGCGERAEGAQNRRLSAESDLLTFTQNTWTNTNTSRVSSQKRKKVFAVVLKLKS